MTDPRERLADLLDQAAGMGSTVTQLRLLEEAAEAADQVQDVDAGFAVRVKLLGTSLEVGRGDILAVHFAWCVARYDEYPGRFPGFDLLWAYRWVISSLACYPEVARPQLEQMLSDMTERYRNAGASLRPVFALKTNTWETLGDRAAVADAAREWKRSPRDGYSDDPAAERLFEVGWLVFERRFADALAALEGWLADPPRSEFIAGRALSRALYPLVLAGRLEEAARCHRVGLPLNAANPRYAARLADHLRFLVLTDNLRPAADLFRKHLRPAVEWVDPVARMEFYMPAGLLFARLRDTRAGAVRLRLPESFPAFRPDGRYDPPALADWFDATIRETAAKFDRRNGNTYWADEWDWYRGQPAGVRPFPLSSRTRAADSEGST